MMGRLRTAARTSVLSLLWAVEKLAPRSAGPNVAILNYHDIGDGGRSPFTVGPGEFAAQIRSIHRAGYSFLDGGGFQQWMTGREPDRGGLRVLLTFDDGYASFETHAMPVLREFGASGILFVHTDRGTVRIEAESPVLDWEAIGRIGAAGFEIGNHSHTHRSVRTLANGEIDEELDRSEELLRAQAGIVPRYFAYPGGVFDDRTKARLIQRGYAAAFGGRQGLASRSSDPMNLERIGLRRETSTLQLFFAMRGALNRLEAMRRRGRPEGR